MPEFKRFSFAEGMLKTARKLDAFLRGKRGAGKVLFGHKNTPVRKEKHRGEKERKKKLKKY